ncbi:MAG: PKD domain-containing protein [Bacteroidota bacterium]
MKKSALLFFLVLFLSVPARLQNLVNNPSFENVNTGSLQCSWYLSIASFNAAINQWTCPTDGTTDVYNTFLANTCYSHPLSTNGSAAGQQTPRTGNGFVNLCTYGNGGCSPWREYVQGSLSSALVVGQQYCVEFYVSMADKNTYASNNLGVYFTTSAWTSSTGGCPYYVTPQLNYTGIITDKVGWTLVSFTFTPTQAFTHFTLGNFYNDGGTSTTNVGGTAGVTRYFVDDVSIQLCSVNPVITVNSPTICAGQSATLTANSSIAGTTYAWSGGLGAGNPKVVTPAITTTYTVTGTAGGNTGTATSVVTVTPIPVITVNSPTICAGQTATLTAGGGTTYSWSTGASTNPINVSPGATTTYTVSGTTSGCTGSTTSIVNVNPIPVITVNSPTICAGQTATLTAGGGTTYSWSTGASTNPINVSPGATTTYTVSGTTTGCTGSTTSIVNVTPIPVITVNSPTICAGQTATLTAGGGTTYSWSTGASTNPINVSPGATTTYTVSGTTSGCTGSTTSIVNVNPIPVITVNSPTICAGQTATLTAGGGTTYSWNTGAATNPINVSPGATTTYTVSGTTSGCMGSTTSIVNVNPIPVITVNSPTICAGDIATLTASGGTTYSWNTGSTANPLNVSPGTTTTYTVSGTTSGCTGSTTSIVTVTPIPGITVNSPTICAGQTATLTAGGGTTYSWNTGASTNPINVSPGATTTYTVSGTTSGCTGSTTAIVTVNPLPNAVITASTDVSCGLSNGSATASGGTSYNWSNGQGTATATGLSAGTYYCTVTQNGCDSIISVVINSIPGYTLSTSFTDEFCSNANGTATVTPNSAGTYGYLWSNSQSSNTITGLIAGTYTVTVTDAYTCTATATVTITNHAGPTAIISNVIPESCSGSNGSMTVVPNGGTAPLTYIWSSGQNTASISGLVAGTYVVTVTDFNTCTVVVTQTISNSPAPVVSLVNIQDVMCGSTDGAVNVSVSGGTAPLTYQWSNGQITQNLTNVLGGTYTLIVSDANGCKDTLTATVNVIGGPQAILTPVNAYCDENNGSITANVSGGTGSYTYLWSNGQTTSYISNLGAGTYSVTVDDGNCTTTTSAVISNSPKPVADFTLAPGITTLENPDITFFNGSTGATQYAWNFGDGTNSSVENPIHTYTETGQYVIVLTVTNSLGCTDSTMQTVIIKDPFSIWVPNAFTPDGDGINDYFGPKGTNFDPDHFEMYIYNRWGEQLFSTTNINHCWDGRVNGNVCKQDVYIWMIILRVNDEKFQKFQGHVTIIR